MVHPAQGIPVEIVNHLVALGQDPEAAAARAALRDQGAVNRLHWDPWQQVARALPPEHRQALFRGLVLAEALPGWAAGPRAAAIWVFEVIQDLDPAREAEAVAFAEAHRVNPFVPFGDP